jgi:hypothetical protein
MMSDITDNPVSRTYSNFGSTPQPSTVGDISNIIEWDKQVIKQASAWSPQLHRLLPNVFLCSRKGVSIGTGKTADVHQCQLMLAT